MVIKCQKMAQMSWNLDQVCISGSCIEFIKKFEKFWKLADFWPENGNFLRFSRCDFGTAFSTENVITQSKMLQLTWFLVYSPPIVPIWDFGNFEFSPSYDPIYKLRGHFFCKKWPKFTKICPFDSQIGS